MFRYLRNRSRCHTWQLTVLPVETKNLNLPFSKPQFSYIPSPPDSTTHLVVRRLFLQALRMILPWKTSFELQTPMWLMLLHVWAAELQLQRDIIPAGHAEQ